jgi:hypothetical protein
VAYLMLARETEWYFTAGISEKLRHSVCLNVAEHARLADFVLA